MKTPIELPQDLEVKMNADYDKDYPPNSAPDDTWEEFVGSMWDVYKKGWSSGHEAAQPKWISVDDRLPECISQHGKNYASGYVLGITEYGEHEIVQLWHNKGWECEDGIIVSRNGYIKYWMELPPSPPKTT